LRQKLPQVRPAGQANGWSAAYTRSNELTSSDVTTFGNVSFEPQNSCHPNRYYGDSELNIPQVFAASLIYKLPFFQEAGGWKQEALGGWQYSVVNVEDDGFSTTDGPSIPNQGLANHPDQIHFYKWPKKFSGWFNTANFTAPAPGHFGNAADGTVLSPGLINFNMATIRHSQSTKAWDWSFGVKC
jgi:hypothetical protein